MSVCNASAARPHDMLPADDVQTMHQEEGQGAPDNATEEKAVADAAAGRQVRWPGPQGATI